MSYWTDKRVVVTGGGGFLGTHVVEKLRDAGTEKIFVVRSRDYDLTHEVDVVRLFSDLKDGRDGWPTATDGSAADLVIHLAGLVGGILANAERPAEFFYQNIMMGTLILEQSRINGVSKVVATGAGCGYPEQAKLPLNEETLWDGFPEYDLAPYSLAKRMLHVQSMARWRQYQLPVIVAIPGNIYGPNDNFDLRAAHVIPALVRKFVDAADSGPDGGIHQSVTVWGSGKPTRDFIYVGDAAVGILQAAEGYDEPQLVNISAGDEFTIAQVVEGLVEATGFKGKVVWDRSMPDGQARRVFDVAKAEAELNFKPKTSLFEGLKLTAEWYRANRHRARLTA